MEDIFDDEEINSLFKKIERTYLAEVIFGRYTLKGSFIALSENGKEYFANKSLVVKNIEEFKLLSNSQKQFWVLVEDQIWGGKWNNKEVSSIVAISNNKVSCLTYKNRLSRRMKITMDLIDVQETHLKLIESKFNDIDFEIKESEILDQTDLLQVQLKVLNEKLSGKI